MKKLVASFLLIIIAADLFSGAVVVIVTREGIILATECHGSPGSNAATALPRIFKAGHYYYAVDGFTRQDSTYDLAKIAGEVLSSGIDYDNMKQELMDRWSSALEAAYRDYRKTHPGDFFSNKFIRSSSVFVLSRRDNIPFYIGFTALISPDTSAEIKIHFVVDKSSCELIARDSAFVYESRIGQVMDRDFKMKDVLKSPRMAAINLVEKSLQEEGDMVAGPIDILWINRNGEDWMNRKDGNNCGFSGR